MNRGQIAALFSGIWLMTHDQIERLAARLALGVKPGQGRQASNADGVAIIPVHGVVEHRASIWSELFGGADTETIGRRLDAAMSDPSVRGIVLDVDSPGGTVPGVQELSDRIYEASHEKPIVAVANSLAASAAYWIASAAGRVVATPGSEVGSIGVYSVHADYSKMLEDDGVKITITKAGKYKAEGNPYEPLSDDAAEYEQRQVDAIYRDFLSSVARGRGVSVATVRENYGQGRTLLATDAASAGLVDEIDTLSGVVARLGGSKMRGVRRLRSMDAESLRRRIEFSRRTKNA